jgi:hypothetical protein
MSKQNTTHCIKQAALKVIATTLTMMLMQSANAQSAVGSPDKLDVRPITQLPPPPQAGRQQGMQLLSSKAFADSQMKAMDRNGDGKLSWEEFTGPFRKVFNNMDKAGKGYITAEDMMREYENTVRAQGMQQFLPAN